MMHDFFKILCCAAAVGAVFSFICGFFSAADDNRQAVEDLGCCLQTCFILSIVFGILALFTR